MNVNLGQRGRLLACEWLLNMPLGSQRQPQSASDFGDDETIGLFLKRIGRSFLDVADGDWGQYAGLRETDEGVRPAIVVRECGREPCDPRNTRVLGYVSFRSLSEMKRHFQLD